jgi:penicillin-binding protein 2
MTKFVTLQDLYRETALFRRRVLVVAAGVLLLALVLLARLFFLQVLQFDYHSTLSERNRIRLEPLPPNRGLIRDAKGRLLAENRPTHSLNIIKEQVKDPARTLRILNSLLPLSADEQQQILNIKRAGGRPFQPIAVHFNLNEVEIARLAVNRYRLPEVVVQADLVRYYPYPELTAHVVGYVGRINEKDQLTIDQARYAGTNHLGKLGLERFYETQLHGEVGYQKVETNARGRELRILEQTDPIPGEELTLYFDLDIQRVAMQAMAGRRGAVVAIELATGGVKAMVSSPSFDGNPFVTGIDGASYRALNESEDRPLFNRVLKGQYPPGSTLKPFVGLAGLHYQKTTWRQVISDPGFYQLEGSSHKYRDWKKGGHGSVDLKKAMAQSCDIFFYRLAHDLEIDRYHDFLQQFGFGLPTQIDIGGERLGVLPSREWKRKKLNQPWYPGETLVVGIGQGYMLATPMQLAVAVAQLAKKGELIQPRLLQSMTQLAQHRELPDLPGLAAANQEPLDEDAASLSTKKLDSPAEISAPVRSPVALRDPEDWVRMFDAMHEVVHGAGGTAKRIAKDIGYQMAGKTGTSQVIAIKQDEKYDAKKLAEIHRDHALFVGFAPVENPQIAVVVLVENGGHGGATAAPIAREVLDAYLLQDYSVSPIEPESLH